MPNKLTELLNQGAETAVNALSEALNHPALKSARLVAKIGVALTVLDGCPKPEAPLEMIDDVKVEKQSTAEDIVQSNKIQMARELDRIHPEATAKFLLDAHRLMLEMQDIKRFIPLGNPSDDVCYINLKVAIKLYLENGGDAELANSFIETFKADRLAALERMHREETDKMTKLEAEKALNVNPTNKAFLEAADRVQVIEDNIKALKSFKFGRYSETNATLEKEEEDVGAHEREVREFITKAEAIGMNRHQIIEELKKREEVLIPMINDESITDTERVDVLEALEVISTHKLASQEEVNLRTNAYDEQGSSGISAEDDKYADIDDSQVVQGSTQLVVGELRGFEYGNFKIDKKGLFDWEKETKILKLVRNQLLKIALEKFAREVMAWEEMEMEKGEKNPTFDAMAIWGKSLRSAAEAISSIDNPIITLSQETIGDQFMGFDDTEKLEYFMERYEEIAKDDFKINSQQMLAIMASREAFKLDTPEAYENLAKREKEERQRDLSFAIPCYTNKGNRGGMLTVPAYLCNGNNRVIGIEDLIEVDLIKGDNNMYFVAGEYGRAVRQPYFISDAASPIVEKVMVNGEEVYVIEQRVEGWLESVARVDVMNKIGSGELKDAEVEIEKPKKEPKRKEERD